MYTYFINISNSQKPICRPNSSMYMSPYSFFSRTHTDFHVIFIYGPALDYGNENAFSCYSIN